MADDRLRQLERAWANGGDAEGAAYLLARARAGNRDHVELLARVGFTPAELALERQADDVTLESLARTLSLDYGRRIAGWLTGLAARQALNHWAAMYTSPKNPPRRNSTLTVAERVVSQALKMADAGKVDADRATHLSTEIYQHVLRADVWERTAETYLAVAANAAIEALREAQTQYAEQAAAGVEAAAQVLARIHGQGDVARGRGMVMEVLRRKLPNRVLKHGLGIDIAPRVTTKEIRW